MQPPGPASPDTTVQKSVDIVGLAGICMFMTGEVQKMEHAAVNTEQTELRNKRRLVSASVNVVLPTK